MKRIGAICLAVIVPLMSLLGLGIYRELTKPESSVSYHPFSAAAVESSKARGDKIIEQFERFRGKNGRYPESLDELVPHYMAEIPRPAEGEGFFYTPKENGYEIRFGFWFARPGDLYPSGTYSSKNKEWFVNQ